MKPYRHITRAFTVIGIFLVSGFILRSVFYPASFGQLGDYRADHLDEAMAIEQVHQGDKYCGDCHDEQFEMKSNSGHKTVACEACHFQPPGHPDNLIAVDRTKGMCARCHYYLTTRPVDFPQVDDLHSHMEERWEMVFSEDETFDAKAECINCHNPHGPLDFLNQE